MWGHGGGHGAEPGRPDGSDEDVVGFNCMTCCCCLSAETTTLLSLQDKRRKLIGSELNGWITAAEEKEVLTVLPTAFHSLNSFMLQMFLDGSRKSWIFQLVVFIKVWITFIKKFTTVFSMVWFHHGPDLEVLVLSFTSLWENDFNCSAASGVSIKYLLDQHNVLETLSDFFFIVLFKVCSVKWIWLATAGLEPPVSNYVHFKV